LEVLVSMVLVALLMVVLAQITSSTSRLWRGTSDKIRSFQNARSAFETMTQSASQATLNTYYEYYDLSGGRYSGQASFVPFAYDRYSELHFLCGPAAALLGQSADEYPGEAIFFQAPLGYTLDPKSVNLDQVLNAAGYYVEFGDDQAGIPSPMQGRVKPRYRYRLMQFLQPSEDLGVYEENWTSHTAGGGAQWFRGPLASASPPTGVLAENVIALVIRPKPDFTDYVYDSRPAAKITPASAASYPTRHQLPPRLDITLVVLDETSAARLEAEFGSSPPLVGMGLSGLFEDISSYETDMTKLKDTLNGRHLNYRVYETEIMIRASKWTMDN
jgi:uncharacterized protein (TIGR02599 family)